MNSSNDTIAAVATGPGGALSVIRVSGPDAVAVCDRIFTPASAGRPLSVADGYTLHYGVIMDGEEAVDDVLVSLFRSPRSYTGEDMVEISCHGSRYISRRIMNLLTENGVRAAGPGEFTLRAFLAGKLDLSQAEAVADTIAAEDRVSHRMAATQMRGGYSADLAALRAELVELASLLELELDFGEEEVEFADRTRLRALLGKIRHDIGKLAASFRVGNALREGVAVAIVGAPNAGKSTLLNALLKEERAMVSDIAGTTRDTVESTMDIGGVRFRFIDTAGIRDTSDALESMGIERTRDAARKADIVLFVVEPTADGSVEIPRAEIEKLMQDEGRRICVVVNKADKLDERQVALIGESLRVRAGAGSDAEGHAGAARGFGAGAGSGAATEAGSEGASETVPEGACNVSRGMPEAVLKADAEFYTEFDAPVRIAGEGVVDGLVVLSARTGDNLQSLLDYLLSGIDTRGISMGETVVSNQRHYEALLRADESLDRVSSALESGLSSDLLTGDIRQALYFLGSITGEITSDEILGSIFSKFCIGK